jgi:hypothetical protein
LSNIKLQEALKKLIRVNRDHDHVPKELLSRSQTRKHRSIGGVIQTSPLKGSEISNYFINKHFDNLKTHVMNIDYQNLVYQSGLQKELQSLNKKRLTLIRKIQHGSEKAGNSDEDYSMNFSQ